MHHCRNLALGLAAMHLFAASALALDWKTTTVTKTIAPFQMTLDAVFEFRNNGSQVVTIRELETNCGCLEAAADRKVYPPGAAGLIKAKFTVGDRTGLYVRTITVLTDEPGSPVRLSLQIEVPLLAEITPRSVAWHLNDPPGEKSVEILPAPGLEITFAEAQSTNDAFAARLETVEPGRHYRLHLTPRATAQPASAAIRLFGREKSGHEVIVSAYASIQ
jgi:hypothetical protein